MNIPETIIPTSVTAALVQLKSSGHAWRNARQTPSHKALTAIIQSGFTVCLSLFLQSVSTSFTTRFSRPAVIVQNIRKKESFLSILSPK